MAKKKLLMLMGAGTSMPLGMPSVAEIDALMRQWSPPLALRPVAPDYFNSLWASAVKYGASGQFTPANGIQPSFEQILGQMMSLAHWEAPPPRGNPLRLAVLGDGNLPTDHLHKQIILHQMKNLFGLLARHMRERCRAADLSSPAFSTYADVLSGLRDRFELGIYSLNYDTLAVSAWPQAFTGFSDDGDFDPRSVFERKSWDFIYHLHGSVHHTLTDPYSATIRWAQDLSAEFHDGDAAPPSSSRSDFMTFPRTTLIAGGFKLDQLLVDPFQTFYASLIRHAHEADAILIAGYGFGDVHVNHALQNRFSRQVDRPPVLVITKSGEDQRTMSQRQSGAADLWAWELARALNCGFDLHAGGVDGRSLISILLEKGGFEEALGGLAAIWHGGFESVATQIDKFSARLS